MYVSEIFVTIKQVTLINKNVAKNEVKKKYIKILIIKNFVLYIPSCFHTIFLCRRYSNEYKIYFEYAVFRRRRKILGPETVNIKNTPISGWNIRGFGKIV